MTPHKPEPMPIPGPLTDKDGAMKLISAAYPILMGQYERIALPGVGGVERQGKGVLITPQATTTPLTIQRLTRSNRNAGQVRSEAL